MRKDRISCSRVKIFLNFSILGGLFLFPILLSAAQNDVLINEIAWMGTEISANDEWLELKNNTSQEIDLTGWTIKASDGTPNITLSGIIAANGYFLLERTDDDSVPNITSDQIYAGALGNSGENLELRDAQNSLIDSANYSDGWPAGDNSTKQTMERISSGWQTGLTAGGTPKAINSSGATATSSEPSAPSDQETSTSGTTGSQPTNLAPFAMAGPDIIALINQEIVFDASESYDPNNDSLTYFWNFGDGATDTEKISKHTYLYPGQYLATLLVSDGELSDLDILTVNIYNSSIIITEFMPNPKGADEKNEWIEIYNQSDQIANLTNWQLDDQASGSPPFIFPANSLIGPKQFLVFLRSITKIALNNNSDQVRLICPDGSIVSEVSYLSENQEGLSVAFDGLDYFWTKISTPGAPNIISSAELGNSEQDFSKNNPQPISQETQNPLEVMANNDYLTQTQASAQPLAEVCLESDGSCLAQTTKISSNVQSQSASQLASLSQNSQSNPKSNPKSKLILIISIIISAALLSSWGLIIIKKYQS